MTGPGPYTFELAPTARRGLAALPEKVASVCAEYIAFRLIHDPWRMSGLLTQPPFKGSRSARPAEGYRIVFSIDEQAGHLQIERIGPRSTVYKP